MFNPKKILVAVSGLILFLGCSDINIYSDFDKTVDFSGYKTYKIYVEEVEVENQNYPTYDNKFNRNRIKKAIEFEMNKLGYRQDEVNPELHAGYQIIIKDQQMTVKNCSGIGAGVYDYWPQCWVNTYEYTEGSLVIYVSDIKNNQVIWQGSASAALNVEPNKVKNAIDKIVKQIFKEYPLEKKFKKSDDIYNISTK